MARSAGVVWVSTKRPGQLDELLQQTFRVIEHEEVAERSEDRDGTECAEQRPRPADARLHPQESRDIDEDAEEESEQTDRRKQRENPGLHVKSLAAGASSPGARFSAS